MKYFLTILFIAMYTLNLHTQSNWSLQASAGIATETNLGNTGLRLSTKISRQFGKSWNAFTQIGTFKIFRSNEKSSGNDAYLEIRSLSTANIDLGGSFFLLSKPRPLNSVFLPLVLTGQGKKYGLNSR